MTITIRRATSQDKAHWLQMRQGIWPEASDEYLDFDMDELLASRQNIIFLAFIGLEPAGLIEASIRDFGEGCDTSPVGYVEAWFVRSEYRRSGVSKRLLQAAEDWARSKGCVEMASDTWLDNDDAIRAHKRHGYMEAERLVHFVKPL